MGTDEDIVDAARLSYDRRGTSEDRALLRYLMRNGHTSPFEMAELKFEIKCPIHVARQWVRHRTASMNEVSARYTTLPNEMYVPDRVSSAPQDNKQGRGVQFSEVRNLQARGDIRIGNEAAYAEYQNLIAGNVAPEIARGNLPLNTYTKFVWKMDLHNLMHFLRLRCDSHAQFEIRQYANVIESITTRLFPVTMEAWGDYIFRSHKLSRWAKAAVQDIMSAVAKGTPLATAVAHYKGVAVPHHMTEREWNEDVVPLTQPRF